MALRGVGVVVLLLLSLLPSGCSGSLFSYGSGVAGQDHTSWLTNVRNINLNPNIQLLGSSRNRVKLKGKEIYTSGEAFQLMPFDNGKTPNGGTMWYREVTSSTEIQNAITQRTGNCVFNLDWALVVTWVEVTYSGLSTLNNTYQAVIASDTSTDITYVIYNYDRMDALFATSNEAYLRYKDGSQVYQRLPGSSTTDITGWLLESSNVDVTSRWIIRADAKVIQTNFSEPGHSIQINTDDVSNGGYYDTISGRTLDVICLMDTGARSVENISLSCGGTHASTAVSTQVTTSFEMTNGLDRTKCECSVEEFLGCVSSTYEVSPRISTDDKSGPVIFVVVVAAVGGLAVVIVSVAAIVYLRDIQTKTGTSA